jgi:succinylglutamate desuccinylase
VVCIGGLHGNEPAGVTALERVFGTLAARREELSGEAVALAGNLAALAKGRRYLDEDLNRIWDPRRMDRLRKGLSPLSREGRELAELDQIIRRLEREARGSLVFLDLHTTSAPGPAFVIADKNENARIIRRHLPVPEVEGLGTVLPGTFLYHLAVQGFAALAFECGQHQDPSSPVRAEAAVWTLLVRSGALAQAQRDPHGSYDQLKEEHADLPRRVEIFYRHAVCREDCFAMDPGFRNFQPVQAEQPLGRDCRGVVYAPGDGYILMPLYQPVGDDGFFLARTVST